MLMTQNDLKKLIDQMNIAFDNQWKRIEILEKKVEELNEKEGSKAGTRRRKRVQQAEENAEPQV